MSRKRVELPSVEAKKVYCTCDETTLKVFDDHSRIEASVDLWPKSLDRLLSSSVLLEFSDVAESCPGVHSVVFLMSPSAAALLGRKLIAASKQEVLP